MKGKTRICLRKALFILLIRNEIKNYLRMGQFPTWTMYTIYTMLRILGGVRLGAVNDKCFARVSFLLQVDVKLFTCAEARNYSHVQKQPFLQMKTFPRSTTNTRLTGARQRQGTHVVLISRLPPVSNLGLPVTVGKKRFLPRPPSLPFHPVSQQHFQQSSQREGSNYRRQ